MTAIHMTCKNCGNTTDISTYRDFTVCHYCGTRTPFPGFSYKQIDWKSSMYASVKHWMDCPVCRSPNVFLGPEGKKWKCPDCGYTISDKEKNKSVFWFCDACETFLNVQKGFTTKTGRWTCTECRYENDVTDGNII